MSPVSKRAHSHHLCALLERRRPCGVQVPLLGMPGHNEQHEVPGVVGGLLLPSSSISKIHVQRAVMAQLQAGCPGWPLPAVLAPDTVPSAVGMILVVAVGIRGSGRTGHGWT